MNKIESVFLENKYLDEYKELPWDTLGKVMRQQLDRYVDRIIAKFDTLSVKKYDSTGKETTDPSIFLGSGGVLFALWKYMKLLNDDANESDRMMDVAKLLSKGLKMNAEMITGAQKADDEKFFGHEEEISFFRSPNVGISTVTCLHIIFLLERSNKVDGI
jgi:hypothetical protein